MPCLNRAIGIVRLALVAACCALVPMTIPADVFAQAATATPAAGALAGHELADAFRRGGYVIYFRHTSPEFGAKDEGMTSVDDCTQQRNLTHHGRAPARAIR